MVDYTLRIHHDYEMDQDENGNYIEPKIKTGHFYLEYVFPDGESEFYGKYPEVKSPIWPGKIETTEEEERFKRTTNSESIITKEVVLSREGFEASKSYMESMVNSPGVYVANIADCISLVQEAYVKAGQGGDFVDLFNRQELSELGTAAGISARLRYGAEGEAVVVEGYDKNSIMQEYNVPADRVIAFPYSGNLFNPQMQFVILPRDDTTGSDPHITMTMNPAFEDRRPSADDSDSSHDSTSETFAFAQILHYENAWANARYTPIVIA
jgi:hypothetical protein